VCECYKDRIEVKKVGSARTKSVSTTDAILYSVRTQQHRQSKPLYANWAHILKNMWEDLLKFVRL
jgi:hypothetical protein